MRSLHTVLYSESPLITKSLTLLLHAGLFHKSGFHMAELVAGKQQEPPAAELPPLIAIKSVGGVARYSRMISQWGWKPRLNLLLLLLSRHFWFVILAIADSGKSHTQAYTNTNVHGPHWPNAGCYA